jgi:paraquat-inducible protein A
LPWAIAGVVLLGCALGVPLVRLSKLGLERTVGIADVGAAFRADGMAPLGWFVDFCLLGAPALLLTAITLLSSAILARRGFLGWRRVLSVVEWSRRWAMLEVLVLAILVSFLKMGSLARASFEVGFAVLAAGAAALLVAQQAFDPREARDVLGRVGAEASRARQSRRARPESLQVSWALLVAAAITLVPANLLPIMEVTTGATTSNSTIFGGIVLLAREGMWGIALVVFVASFLVPVGKLCGLFWLLVRARLARGTAQAVRLHGWLDLIGRWSMLDILLIGVLGGLVQFGSLAHVRAGPGAPAFAAAVVLTVLAVDAFPMRRLFSTAGASAN